MKIILLLITLCMACSLTTHGIPDGYSPREKSPDCVESISTVVVDVGVVASLLYGLRNANTNYSKGGPPIDDLGLRPVLHTGVALFVASAIVGSLYIGPACN